MELKEFIKEVLSDITNAVKESQDELTNGSVISPMNDKATEKIRTTEGSIQVSYIEFDVSVSVGSENGKEKGVSVMSAILGAKYGAENKTLSESVSRIKFSIPVAFPVNWRSEL